MPPPRPLWSLVVPVKRLTVAKSRLDAFAARTRAELALAFALDTVTAALQCPLVGAVVVVTDEPGAAHELGRVGALVVPDRPDAGLNPALAYGAQAAVATHPGAQVGALASDLPALRSGELAVALRAAGGAPTSFVADTVGTGTTLYAARDAAAFTPAFGSRSAAEHAARGAVELDVRVPTLRRDVDTVVDLYAALALGIGQHTGTVVHRLGLGRRLG